MISLSYLLIYMTRGTLDFIKFKEQDEMQLFKLIMQKKSEQTPEELCQANRCLFFLDFTKVVHSMTFEEAPDYGLLQQMLMQVLHDQGIEPSSQLDWCQPQSEESLDNEVHKNEKT